MGGEFLDVHLNGRVAFANVPDAAWNFTIGGTKVLKKWLAYDPKKVWAQIVKRVVAAGGKRITMYGMRHSFASNLLIAGVSDVKVSRWLGHADTRMPHRHYGHLLSYDGDINAVSEGPARERTGL